MEYIKTCIFLEYWLKRQYKFYNEKHKRIGKSFMNVFSIIRYVKEPSLAF